MLRVFLMAVLLRRLRRQHPELFDSRAAVAAVEAALADASEEFYGELRAA